MNKIIENPQDLTKLKEYLESIGLSPQIKFSHDLLLKISKDLNLTINEACLLARDLREEFGRNCVEADFKNKMQEACVECKDFFEVVTEIFDIHYTEKDPVTGKKTKWTTQEQRNVVYCKDVKGKIVQLLNLSTYVVPI